MIPRMTAFQMRNKASGIALPRTIAVLHNNIVEDNMDVLFSERSERIENNPI